MSDNFLKLGYLSGEELAMVLPSTERLAKGPVAVIECLQDIPCNPCEAACHFQAITVGKPITSLPKLVEGKCAGCGLCITQCPGLAIFVVDGSEPGDEGTVQMPYEYWPIPQLGEVMQGLDRKGDYVCQATVTKVSQLPQNDSTAAVTVKIPKQHINAVRSVKRPGGISNG